MAPKSLLDASCRLLALSWRLSALSLASLAGLLALLGPLGRLLGRSWGDFKLQDKTWLSWNGKRVLRESCKHCKRLTTKPQSIKKAFSSSLAFSSSFAGALRAPAQRLGGVSLGTPLARAGSTHRFKHSKMKRKWLENAPPGAPRSLQNRSKVPPRGLPGPPRERKQKW